MRYAALLLISLGAVATAHGQELGVQQQRIDLAPREPRTLTVLCATAAWAIDPSIVETSIRPGELALTGRSPGRTKVVVVCRGSETTIDVVVTGKKATAVAARGSAQGGTAEVRYSSAQKEVLSSVSVSREAAGRRTEAQVVHAHTAAPQPGQPQNTLPSVSYRIFTRDRELTLLDRMVDYSPLTLSSTSIRGVHYLDEHWRIHAGVTAWSSHRSFLLPVDREAVAGVGYAFKTGGGSTITPGVFAFPGKGNIASLLWETTGKGGLQALAEVAVSGGVGGAARVSWDGVSDRARVDLRYRPADFAAVGPGEVRGFFGDASWNRQWAGGSTASVSLSATDFARIDEKVFSAAAQFDTRVSPRFTATSGASWALLAGSRSISVPAGIRFDSQRFSAGLRYRWSRHSATSRGSHGVRLSARATVGAVQVSGYADRSADSPTLSVIFREQPDLALALEELGLSIDSPEDVARALREHASLAELGFVDGISVDLAPMRTQLGLEASWSPDGASRHQLRARVLRSLAETVAGSTETTIASLTWSRRLSNSTDIFARYSTWTIRRRGQETFVQPQLEAGVRHRFDELPALMPRGKGTIAGVVFADEDLDGTSDGSGIAGAEVSLDGSRKALTGADGTFRFETVPRGAHQLVARIPSRPEAYFTTPSRIETRTGERAAFGVAITPARLLGRLTDDAGAGIGNATLELRRGRLNLTATTDSDGRFAFSGPPGEWTVTVAAESLPAGYSAASTAPQQVSLDRSAPGAVAFVVRALRSMAVTGLQPRQQIRIEELNRSVQADAQGRAAFRSLPAGTLTLVAGGRRRAVTLHASPGTTPVDFGPASGTLTVRPAAAANLAPPSSPRHESSGSFLVQLGVFRKRENAVEIADRARRAGVETSMAVSRELTIVRSRPYQSRSEATAVAAILVRDGLDAIVTKSP